VAKVYKKRDHPNDPSLTGMTFPVDGKII